MSRRGRKLLAGLAVTLGVFALAELALRATVPADTLRFAWESPDPLLVLEDDTLRLEPGRRIDKQDGDHPWQIRTNRFGMREDHDPPAQAPAGILRLLALGDSWMFGHNADQDRTLPEQLEALLPSMVEAERVEVLNGAIFGSCAFDMLRRWRQLSALFEVHGVLLGTPHNETRQRALADQRQGWYRRVRGAPWVDVRVYLALRYLLAPLTRPQYPYLEADQPSSGIPDLVTLATDARDQGLPVWFVGMPTNRMQPVEARARTLEPWAEALAPLGVKLVGHTLPQRSCWGNTDPHHPSEAGYRALAEAVAPVVAGRAPGGAMVDTPACGTSTSD
ncbi:MAG: SGNH/GDSL hydrolase family protein [Alphaproteobacteria bacterium]|nr:SGNH/GDSL hydrolase family protein [Alphaproteobacteria bacterium]